jgi:hypothetical protein
MPGSCTRHLCWTTPSYPDRFAAVISEVIWAQRIWTVQRAIEGWRRRTGTTTAINFAESSQNDVSRRC